MSESAYQNKLIRKLTSMFPGCFIQKNDPASNQGIPDLLILFKGRWAMLEVKANARAATRPNQEYHVDQFNNMSFAAFIYPENEEEILNDLQFAFGS